MPIKTIMFFTLFYPFATMGLGMIEEFKKALESPWRFLKRMVQYKNELRLKGKFLWQ